MLNLSYRATREADGSLIVHRVPIFVECERGEVNFDADWVTQAVERAHAAAREGYYPPLHIRHHEPATERTNSVRAAGFFKVLGAEAITFKGARRLAIMADLVITDRYTQQEVIEKRLPYRSVEIFNVERPSIDSLALLDHEAPFLQLPMLMVDVTEEPGQLSDNPNDIYHVSTNEPGAGGLRRVAFATVDNPWKSRTFAKSPEGVVACFRHGNSAALIFQETPLDNDDTKQDEELEPQAQNFGDDEGSDDKSETMESAPLDVGAVVKAISDGSISVADMDAILAAIQEQRAGSEQEEPAADAAAPAAAPGAGEAMKDENLGAENMALRGRIDALEAREKARDEEEQRRIDVDEALAKFEGRPVGANFREKLEEMHKLGGREAFTAYVESFRNTIGVAPASESAAHNFAGQARGVSELAMKFQEYGTEAVEAAVQFEAEWDDLRLRRMTQMSKERYVEVAMASRGPVLTKS